MQNDPAPTPSFPFSPTTLKCTGASAVRLSIQVAHVLTFFAGRVSYLARKYISKAIPRSRQPSSITAMTTKETSNGKFTDDNSKHLRVSTTASFQLWFAQRRESLQFALVVHLQDAKDGARAWVASCVEVRLSSNGNLLEEHATATLSYCQRYRHARPPCFALCSTPLRCCPALLLLPSPSSVK